MEGLDPAIFFQLLRVTQQTPTTASIIRRHCVQGEIVFREGEKGDTMYMVLAGRCAMVKGDLEFSYHPGTVQRRFNLRRDGLTRK